MTFPSPGAVSASSVCAHCGLPQRGSAAVTVAGVTYNLCHPDIGLDCYHLVTVYKEPIGARRGSR
jgi:hypothetical protein